jgi:endonuclease YncB( thermonuclease family)
MAIGCSFVAVVGGAILALAWGSGLLAAGEKLPGPIPAEIVRVVDGDTVEVDARIWLGQKVRTQVRLLGVDTPELAGRCESERALAKQAKEMLARMLSGGQGPHLAELREVDYDKYGGRVLAKIFAADGADVAAKLIGAGLARPYAGGARAPWCVVG